MNCPPRLESAFGLTKSLFGPGLTPGLTMAVLNIPGFVAPFLLAVIFVVDFLITRAAWRTVSRSQAAAVPRAPYAARPAVD